MKRPVRLGPRRLRLLTRSTLLPRSTPLRRLTLLTLLTLVAPLGSKPAMADSNDCPEPLGVERLQAGVMEVRALLVRTEEEASLRLIDQLLAQLPCANTLLPQEPVARLFYYRGLALGRRGRHLESLQAFQDARTLLPSLADDETFEPGPREPFRQLSAPPLSQTLHLQLLPGQTVWVDGEIRPFYPSTPLAPGPHLLQRRWAGQWRETRLLLLEETPGAPHRLRFPESQTLAWTMGGVAVLAGAGSVGLALSSQHSYAAWDEGAFEQALIESNHHQVAGAAALAGLATVAGALGLALVWHW